MFHHLDFPRLFLCESTGYSKHKTTGIASVAICGGSNHILTGLYMQSTNLLAKVIFTPLVTLEQRNDGVYTSMQAQDYKPYQLTFNYILVTIILNWAKSKIREF